MNNQEEDKDGLNYDKNTPMAPFLAMFKFSNCRVKTYLVLGILASILAGFSMPMFIVFLGDLYNAFDPETSASEVYGK